MKTATLADSALAPAGPRVVATGKVAAAIATRGTSGITRTQPSTLFAPAGAKELRRSHRMRIPFGLAISTTRTTP